MDMKTSRFYNSHFRLALKLSEDVRQPIPTIAAANELYKVAMARDQGDADMCAVSEALKN